MAPEASAPAGILVLMCSEPTSVCCALEGRAPASGAAGQTEALGTVAFLPPPG